MDFVDRIQGQGDAEYTVSLTFQNISCLQLTLWLPDEPPSDLHLFSLSIVSIDSYITAIEAANVTVPTALLSDVEHGFTNEAILADSILAGCSGAQCNAAASTWLQITNLDPDIIYLVLQAPASYGGVPRTGGSPNFTRISVIMQPFPAGESSNIVPMALHSSQACLYLMKHACKQ